MFCGIICPSALFGNVSKYAEAVEVHGVNCVVLTSKGQASVTLLLRLNAMRR